MARGATGDRSAPIRLLQLTAFVSTLDRFIMPPMLIAIARDLDVPLSQVVQAAGAYFLAYGLMQPVWGIVSDRLGLVATMRLTLALAAVSGTAAAFVSTPLALGVSRGLTGGFFGAAYPASLIYIGDTVPARQRHKHVTDLMVGVALGTSIASVGGGVVAQLVSWRAAFLITALGALVLAHALRRLPRPPRTRDQRSVLEPLRELMGSAAARLVLTLAFLEGAVLLGALTLLPAAVEATGSSASVAGAVTATYGLAVYAFARWVGRLSTVLHASRLIGLGAGSSLLGCGVMAFRQTPTIAIVVSALLALAWAAMHSTLQTWATEVIPGARATVVSMFAGSLFVGSACAAVAVAGLAEADRYRAIYAMAAAATVPMGLLAVRGRMRWRRPDEEPA
jgi:predicted MFS family arabinose efflux permease